MTIKQVLRKIKREFDATITMAQFNGKLYYNGNSAKEALIRSQRIINYIHNFVKNEFVKTVVNKEKIYPSIGKTIPEIKLNGFLKSKNQDIVIIPDKNISTRKVPMKICCPECGSKKNKKNGHIPNGKQNHRCKSVDVSL